MIGRPSRRALIFLMLAALAACQSAPPVPTDSPDLQKVKAAVSETIAWDIARTSREAAVLESYLGRFSDGEHASTAALRLKLLQKGAIQ